MTRQPANHRLPEMQDTDHAGKDSSLVAKAAGCDEAQAKALDHVDSDSMDSGTMALDPFLARLFDKIAQHPKVPRRIRSGVILRARKKIGQGGLGEVYSFFDLRLRRTVALKLSRANALGSQNRVDRFLRERKLAAKLQHPAIPPVYACGELNDGRPYYTMRLVEGKNLTERIKAFHASDGVQSPGNDRFGFLLDSFQHVCDALDYAHQQRVLHRDLKPSNVMVEDDGTTFLVDWGLAREFGEGIVEGVQDQLGERYDSRDWVMTHDGQQLGSPEYMSPEQASGSTSLHTTATDIYGLGAILYQIISGRPPHAKLSADEKLQHLLGRISTSAPPDATLCCKGVAPELASICQRAMATDPSARYSSAGELKKDLVRWRRRDPVAAHQGKYSWIQRIEMQAGKHRRLISLAVAFILVVAIAAFWATVQVSKAAEQTELALQRQRQTNAQLLSSLEKFADAVMEDDVLATPQLQSLRNRLLADLTEQYQIFTIAGNATPEETGRAARGSLRLSRIERETGNLARAIDSGSRAIGFARSAIELAQPAEKKDAINILFEALLENGDVLLQAGEWSKVDEHLKQLDALYASVKSELPSPQDIELAIDIERLKVALAYRNADRSGSDQQRTAYFEAALNHCDSMLKSQQRLLALNPSKENSGRLIGGLSRKALVLHKLYRLDQAIEHYEQAFEMLDQRLAEAEESEQTKWIEMKIGMIFNAIMSYRAANDLEKVREVGSIGLQLCIDLKVRYPLVIRYSQEYARACGNYAESLWYAYLASPQDNQQTLEMAIDIFGKGAQQYRELSRLYPERNGFRGGAAIQYLRLSTALFWIGRQTEAETAFRKVLELSEQPEDIEPLHGPNALAVFTGYCMVIIKESTDQPLEHPFVNRFEKVLKVAEVALKDVKSPYVGRFLSEPLYQHFVGNEHFDRAYELASQTAKTIQQP